MSENYNVNKRCIKGNTTYYKIKISDMINFEINKLGVNESIYQKLDNTISEKLSKFTEKMISGSDFTTNMTKLRDDIITECVNVEEKSSSIMRPYFKDYMFDKIYTMGINIKNGITPDDCQQILEEEKLKIEEDKLREEQEKEQEQENKTSEINIILEDELQEKDPDIVDQMWNYFFGGSTSSKKEKKPEKEEKTKNKEEKEIKAE